LASCASEAERIVTEEVQRRGWQEQDLVSRRKNDHARLEIAARLRRQTALSLREIAALVHLGTSKTANSNLREHTRGATAKDPSQAPLGI
jgi:hypothetical protein